MLSFLLEKSCLNDIVNIIMATYEPRPSLWNQLLAKLPEGLTVTVFGEALVMLIVVVVLVVLAYFFAVAFGGQEVHLPASMRWLGY